MRMGERRYSSKHS